MEDVMQSPRQGLAANGPVKESEFGKELGGVVYQEERVRKLIGQIESALTPILRQPVPEGAEKTAQQEPITQVGKAFRELKNKLSSDCEYLESILRRLEL
jgi:hypothetical protein